MFLTPETPTKKEGESCTRSVSRTGPGTIGLSFERNVDEQRARLFRVDMTAADAVLLASELLRHVGRVLGSS